MLLKLLLPRGGPIWGEFVADAIDKCILTGALSVVTNWNQVKAIHDEYMNSNSAEPIVNPNQVINVFTDVNK